jgi:type I restriction enzyme R subunit
VRKENSVETPSVEKAVALNMTTQKIFEKELHAYTITHAIEDKNVISFHIDYFGVTGQEKAGQGREAFSRLCRGEIVKKHDCVTNNRKFNAILATASITEAIRTMTCFKITNRRLQKSESGIAP